MKKSETKFSVNSIHYALKTSENKTENYVEQTFNELFCCSAILCLTWGISFTAANPDAPGNEFEIKTLEFHLAKPEFTFHARVSSTNVIKMLMLMKNSKDVSSRLEHIIIILKFSE